MSWDAYPLTTEEVREIYLDHKVEYGHEQEEQEERFDLWLEKIRAGTDRMDPEILTIRNEIKAIFEDIYGVVGPPGKFIENILEKHPHAPIMIEDRMDEWGRPTKFVKYVTLGESQYETLHNMIDATIFRSFFYSAHRGGLYQYEVSAYTWDGVAGWDEFVWEPTKA